MRGPDPAAPGETARLLIEYDGAPFAGWAVQPGKRTVQGELEQALAVVLRRPVTLTVAGRTDSGVHAWGQVASHPGEPAAARSLNAVLRWRRRGARERGRTAGLRRPPGRRQPHLLLPRAHPA